MNYKAIISYLDTATCLAKVLDTDSKPDGISTAKMLHLIELRLRWALDELNKL